ncbi:MAG TPA: hypothetical protein PKI19_04280 [Elusimicrobiales bacterium]|nr:hypothetical protein [Elusimicrobiales bacterium]
MKIILAAVLIFLLPAAAAAQSGPAAAGRPPKPRASVSTSYSYISAQDLPARRAALRGETALGSAAGLELRAGGELASLRTGDGGYFPRALYKAALNLTAEDKDTRLAVQLNSNSDHPFHSAAETDLGFNFARTFSERGAHAWLFGLNYSTRRTFARALPLPFITYRYVTKDLYFLFPFLARWQASREISISASYQPVKYFRLGGAWRPVPFFNLTLEGGTGLEQYLPAGRPRKGEALYYETSSVSLKPELSLSRRLRLGAELGWQFSGVYFTGKAYDDHHAKTAIGAGPSAGLSAAYNF